MTSPEPGPDDRGGNDNRLLDAGIVWLRRHERLCIVLFLAVPFLFVGVIAIGVVDVLDSPWNLILAAFAGVGLLVLIFSTVQLWQIVSRSEMDTSSSGAEQTTPGLNPVAEKHAAASKGASCSWRSARCSSCSPPC